QSGDTGGGGRPGAEVEPPARAPGIQFRLEMVQLVADQIDSEADRVSALAPSGVRDIGVNTVIAHHRTPVIDISEGRIAGDVVDRETALPRIGSIRAWDLENIRAIIGSEI